MGYREINTDLWNKWAKLHIDSSFYNVAAFKEGESSLKEIELEILGDIKGKSILHLQCHFGQDSLSLARLGAKVTGADISDEAIGIAKSLNDELELDAEFVCGDVLALSQHLEGQFDIVYTSYGALCWLPNLSQWAEQVNHFLKPRGRLIIVEFHPFSNIFNGDFSKLTYSYFRTEKGIIEDEEGSYGAPERKDVKGKSMVWDYSFSELFTAILNKGLSIEHFQEYDYSPYDIYSQSISTSGKFQIKGLEGMLPLVYALVARK